jgi:hypothetical protein
VLALLRWMEQIHRSVVGVPRNWRHMSTVARSSLLRLRDEDVAPYHNTRVDDSPSSIPSMRVVAQLISSTILWIKPTGPPALLDGAEARALTGRLQGDNICLHHP